MTDHEATLKELRDEIAGYAPEDDGYILLRPSKAWRIHDELARLLEVEKGVRLAIATIEAEGDPDIGRPWLVENVLTALRRLVGGG